MLFSTSILEIFVIISSTLAFETTHPSVTTRKSIANVEVSIEDIQNDAIQDQLFQVIQGVGNLHQSERYFQQNQLPVALSPPKLRLETDFMHSALLDHSKFNREDIHIEAVSDVSLEEDLKEARAWTHASHNSSQVLAVTLPSHFLLWRLYSEVDTGLTLNYENAFAILGPFEGEITSSLLFLHSTPLSDERLYLAVASKFSAQTELNVYRVNHYDVKHISIMKLNETVVKMTFLEYLNGGTLAVLVETTEEKAPLTLIHSSNLDESLTVLKAVLPAGVDLHSFYTNGKNFIVVTNASLCVVFSLGQDSVDAELFDVISMDDIVRIDSFISGNELFLLIIGRQLQNVFLVNSNELVFTQALTVPLVIDALILTTGGCRDDTILVLTDETEQDTINLFIWTAAGEFKVVRNDMIVPAQIFPLQHSMTYFSQDNLVYLLFVDQPTFKSRALTLKYSVSELIDPVLLKGSAVADIIEQLEAALEAETRHAELLNTILSNSVQPFSKVQVPQTLTNIEVIMGGIKAASIGSTIESMTWEGSMLTQTDLQWSADDLSRELDRLEDAIHRLENEIDDVVLLNESATLTGFNEFDGMVHATAMEFDDLTLPDSEGQRIKNLLADVFRIDRPQLIRGKVEIAGNLHVSGDTNTKVVNNLQLSSQVMLTSRPQVITGPVSFRSTLTTVGNISFTNGSPAIIGSLALDQIIPLDGGGTINWPVKLTETVHVTRNLVAPTIDGVDLADLTSTALVTNREQVIEVRSLPAILVPSTRVSDIRVTGKVNGINFDDLARNIARLDKPSSFSGNMVLHRPNFENGLLVAGRYDGVNFPASIFQKSLSQIVTAPKHFLRLSVIGMGVRGRIDGLDLPKDIMTLTGDEFIDAPLSFDGGVTSGGVEIDGLVDGSKLPEILTKAVVPLQQKSLNAVFMGTVIVERHLYVENYSPQDVDVLKKDLIFPEDTLIRMTGDKMFPHLSAPKIILNSKLGGYNVTDDFVRLHGDQIIKGTKTFRKSVNFGRHLTTGNSKINEVNIADLYANRISIHQDSVISGSLFFNNPIEIEGDLHVEGRVNDITFPQDLILPSSRSVQLKNKVFHGGISTGELVVLGDARISGNLDGVQLDSFLRRRVTLSQDHFLYGSYTFGLGNVATSVQALTVNEIDLVKLRSEIILASEPQDIFAETVEFSGTTTVFGEITTTLGLNGYRFQDINDHVIKLNQDIFFGKSVTFTNNLFVKGDLTSFAVNGLDLDQWQTEHLVRRTGGHLTGTNVFFNDIHVTGNILSSSVNGIKLKQELLLKNVEQTITGKYIFKDIQVRKDLVTDSTVCGLDLSEIHERVVRIDRHSVLNGNLIFRRPLLVRESVDVLGMVNDLKMSLFADEGVFKDREHVLTTKILTGPVMVRGDMVVEKVNEFNLEKIIEDMVFVDQPASFSAATVFQSPVIVAKGEVNIGGSFNVSGMVNGLHVQNWVNEIVFLNRPQVHLGDVTLIETASVDGSLIVNGKINKINIKTETLQLNSPQTIISAKTFSKLVTEKSISVRGTINGVHLPTLLRDTLQVSGDQAVTGEINVEGYVEFMENVSGKVNDLDLVAEIVRLDSSFVELDGKVVFNGQLIVQGDLKAQGQICNIDVPVLVKNAVYKDKDQVIEAPLFFEDVKFNDVVVLGQVAGIDLDVFQNNLNEMKLVMHEQQKQLKAKNKVLDDATQSLSSSTKQRETNFARRLERHQTLNVTGYVTGYLHGRVEVLTRTMDTTAFSTFLKISDGSFVFEESRGQAWAALLATVHLEEDVFRLWADRQGNAALTRSGFFLLNTSRVVDGDMFGYSDKELLLATLHPDSCQLSRVPRIPEFDNQPAASLIIPEVNGGRSVRLVGDKSNPVVYVGIDTSPFAPHDSSSVQCPPMSSAASLLVYSWDVPSGELRFVQQLAGGSNSLAHFVHNGFEYLVKADAIPQLATGHSLQGIKLYRKGSTFDLVSVLQVPNIQDLDVFNIDKDVFCASVNATHLIISYLAGARGLLVHSMVPCAKAYSVRALPPQEEENGVVYLAVSGQSSKYTPRDTGVLQFFKLTSSGLRETQRRVRRRS